VFCFVVGKVFEQLFEIDILGFSDTALVICKGLGFLTDGMGNDLLYSFWFMASLSLLALHYFLKPVIQLGCVSI